MKKVVQLTILMLIVTFLANNSFAEQNRNELLRGIWKSNTGSIVRIDGNQGVLIETSSESWKQYINKPIIKNIRPKYDGWTVNELIKVIGGFQWIEITWELVDNKIHKRLLYLKSEEKNYYEKVDNEISAKEKKSYLPPDLAEDYTFPGLSGFYATASIGYAKSDYDFSGFTDKDDSDTAYSIGIGYDFNKYIAIETGWLDLGQISGSVSDSASGTLYGKSYTATGAVTFKAEADGFYLGPIVSIPVTEKFKAYAKAGVYFWDMDADASATISLTYDGTTYAADEKASLSDDGEDLYYGLGASYDVTDKLTVRADWIRYDVYDVDIDLFSASLIFKFGKLF